MNDQLLDQPESTSRPKKGKALLYTERVLAIVAVVSLVLMLLQVNLTTSLLVYSVTLLSILYFPIIPIAAFFSKRYSSIGSKLAMMVFGYGAFSMLLAIIFVVLGWNGWKVMQFHGMAMAGLSVVLFLFLRSAKGEAVSWFTPRLAVFAVPFIVSCFLVPSHVFAIRSPYGDDAKLVGLYKQCKDNNTNCEAYYSYYEEVDKKHWEQEMEARRQRREAVQ